MIENAFETDLANAKNFLLREQKPKAQSTYFTVTPDKTVHVR